MAACSASSKRMRGLVITGCGDDRVNGKYVEAKFLSSNQLMQFWHADKKSTLKMKQGYTGIPGMNYAWVIIEMNLMRPSDSLTLFAAEGTEGETFPPSDGWEAVGGIEPAPVLAEIELSAAAQATAENECLIHLKERVSKLTTRAFIYSQSAEIHGGAKGLYDFGPTGCALKANWIQQWRNHFIIAEDMLEIEATCLTPKPVLVASGHVAKFSDFMCKDVVTGDPHRADVILEDFIDDLLRTNENMSEEERLRHKAVQGRADAMQQDELAQVLREYGVKAPGTGNDLTEPYEFNLMFATQIGPTGDTPGYLRPETAQGIFVNFAKLLTFNRGQTPFAAAQIGLAFRNEIAPRGGLVRLREFQQAEIEHFCGIDNGEVHPKFDEVADLVMNFLPDENQTGEDIVVQLTIGDAVARGMVSNQTLGYYLARGQLFYETIGINLAHLRFRQHKKSEMAHYARDCWDAELYTTGGWLEVTGNADRSCYDLVQHSKATGVDLQAELHLQEPEEIIEARKKPNKAKIGRKFRRESKKVLAYIDELSDADAIALVDDLKAQKKVTITTCEGDFELEDGMLEVEQKKKLIHKKNFYPYVVEPSYGVGRVMYSLLEHAYWERPEDENRCVLSLPPLLAPYKISVLPLSRNPSLSDTSKEIHRLLKYANISTKFDDSSAPIGKKYSRSDEVGTPFACTIDFRTLEDRTVTLRERDTCQQIRCPIEDLVDILWPLIQGNLTWNILEQQYEIVEDCA